MSGPARLTVRHAMASIAAGNAEILGGRGVNTSYRVADTFEGRFLSVKVHCADRSAGPELPRIERVDAALRGAPWYPPVIDIGFHPAKRPRLVVIRPFVPGAPSDDARRHIDHLTDVLAELGTRAAGTEAAAELAGDYASPWLHQAEREHALAGRILTGARENLARALDAHLADLRDSALRLTRADAPVIYHGDLHGRNLIFDSSRPLTVIDWDEAGFSHRPADAGKALWLSCRQGRGDFVLDPLALRRFLRHIRGTLRIPYADCVHLARLGALWFLPRQSHTELLGQRDASLVPWYFDWVSRFWSRFRQNLDQITETAAALARDTDRAQGDRA
ncbi:aminoglycoside phosphotransferase family protein [Streptomyces monticola]|uniref:Aminoglycoside phosphotransferase family protein n=1 Tax=Streptomyces monticola TaxID=2666263 RepID=A0ABW2JRL9_9ACTN